jgi:hypothetical protein
MPILELLDVRMPILGLLVALILILGLRVELMPIRELPDALIPSAEADPLRGSVVVRVVVVKMFVLVRVRVVAEKMFAPLLGEAIGLVKMLLEPFELDGLQLARRLISRLRKEGYLFYEEA